MWPVNYIRARQKLFVSNHGPTSGSSELSSCWLSLLLAGKVGGGREEEGGRQGGGKQEEGRRSAERVGETREEREREDREKAGRGWEGQRREVVGSRRREQFTGTEVN